MSACAASLTARHSCSGLFPGRRTYPSPRPATFRRCPRFRLRLLSEQCLQPDRRRKRLADWSCRSVARGKLPGDGRAPTQEKNWRDSHAAQTAPGYCPGHHFLSPSLPVGENWHSDIPPRCPENRCSSALAVADVPLQADGVIGQNLVLEREAGAHVRNRAVALRRRTGQKRKARL